MSDERRREVPPDIPSFGADDVENWFVAAFLSLPGAGVWSGSGRILPVDRRQAPGTYDLFVFGEKVLGRRDRNFRALMYWAKDAAAKKARERGVPGPVTGSLSAYCEEYGCTPSELHRWRKAAARKIAAAWTARLRGGS
jgi:hypothetical protein